MDLNASNDALAAALKGKGLTPYAQIGMAETLPCAVVMFPSNINYFETGTRARITQSITIAVSLAKGYEKGARELAKFVSNHGASDDLIKALHSIPGTLVRSTTEPREIAVGAGTALAIDLNVELSRT